MKISVYTFPFRDGEECYLYNTLSNALMEVGADDYLRVETAASEGFPVGRGDFDEELYAALLENNFITESDRDDFLTYKSVIMRQRSQRDSMHLTLAPTMDCCFRCHYCFEKYKEKKYMTPEVMDGVVKYATAFPDLRGIRITWFGGEPLMALPQMEEFHRRLTEKWSGRLSSNIITTGYHIDREAVRVLKAVGVSSVQITLDGMRETHNRVKHLDGCDDVFGRVLDNIGLLTLEAPEIHTVVRVNLTRTNAGEYVPLYRMLTERFRGRTNFSVSPAFVLDRGASEAAAETRPELFGHRQRSRFILGLAREGIPSPFVGYPERFFTECAIRNDMAVSFDPEGYMYKCWEVIGNKEYAVGRLDSEGRLVETNRTLLNRQLYGADPVENKTCSACRYLPVCNGGCPLQRIENEFEGKKNCLCTHYKGYMEEFLKVYLAIKRNTVEIRAQ